MIIQFNCKNNSYNCQWFRVTTYKLVCYYYLLESCLKSKNLVYKSMTL